jgi:predicted kinase
VTRRERQAVLRISAGLLRHAADCRNAAAVITERSVLPEADATAATLRTWAGQVEDWAAGLDGLVLGTRLER